MPPFEVSVRKRSAGVPTLGTPVLFVCAVQLFFWKAYIILYSGMGGQRRREEFEILVIQLLI